MRELGGRVLFVPAVMATEVLYLASVWFVAPWVRDRAPHSLFGLALTGVYVGLFLLVYAALRLAYWDRLSHVDDGHGIRVLGVSLQGLLRRTGSAYIDIVGACLGLPLAAATFFLPSIQVLAPLAALAFLAFLGAIIAGTSEPWPTRRRGNG